MCCIEAEHPPVGRLVGSSGGEIVEGFLRDADDVVLDERRAFASAVLGMLQAAFPFEHGPGIVIVLGELGEDRAEIDLSVAERAEPAGAVDPALIAAIDADAAGRIELRILHVERLDALVVEIDEGEIVELLQQEMARIVVDARARDGRRPRRRSARSGAVVKILAGMDFVADVAARLVECVEDRPPATAEFLESGLDQTRPGAAATDT